MAILFQTPDAWLATVERGQQRWVFTNGCFDLLHPGHLHLLREARKLGDLLIVGINSDASVKRLKGPGRPVQALDIRMRQLAELSEVDVIIPFEEDTPLELIRIIRPDVLVKGGDYTAAAVVGHDIVREVVIIPLLPGYSTTQQLSDRKKH